MALLGKALLKSPGAKWSWWARVMAQVVVKALFVGPAHGVYLGK